MSCHGLCSRSSAGALAIADVAAVALEVVHLLVLVLLTGIQHAVHAST